MLTHATYLIWAGFSVFGVIVLALFGFLAWSQRRSEDRLHGLASRHGSAELAREVNELEMVAADTMRAAQAAAIAAERAEAELIAAEAERERAWHEHNLAIESVEKATAELDSLPVDTVLPDETQRQVSQAARDAYRRGELTLEQLRAVWQRVDGWGKSIEDKTHEVSRLRAEAADAYRQYHLAAHAERLARKAVEVTQVAARALRHEATDAARDAVLAQMRAKKKGLKL